MYSGISTWVFWLRASLIGLLLAVSGCSMDSDESSSGLRSPADTSLSGSVGDGPVVAADVTIVDANGEVVATSTSDVFASYEIVVPINTLYPVTVSAEGGTDLVTGRPLDFTLRSVVTDPAESMVNLSPINTIATRTAECMAGGATAENLELAWSTVAAELSMGLDFTQLPRPMHDPITPTNAAAVVLANEGLAEALRRTQAALAPTSEATDLDGLAGRIACDLTDGLIDGAGPGADSRTAATFFAVVADVTLEMLSDQLEVDGQNAVFQMDAALRQVFPDVPDVTSVTAVPVTEALVTQSRDALAIQQSSLEDESLTKFVVLLDEAPTEQAATTVSVELTPVDEATMDGLADRVAVSDQTTLEIQMSSSRKKKDALPPIVSFAADPEQLAAGDESRISWASANADRCLAKGAWKGRQALEGTFMTGPLDTSAEYRLSCSGMGGSDTRALTLSVADAPLPATPQVNLAANAASVFTGDSVTLSWTSADVDACAASGGWSGSRSAAGSESIGPLNASSTFSLTCDGPGGSATDSISVTVQDPPTPAPTVSLLANPTNLLAGNATQLSWSSTDAASCVASGAWSGVKGTSGTEPSASLSTTSTFGLSCTGVGGTTSRSVTVTVEAPAAPTLSLAASPTEVAAGGSTQLTWSATNTTGCTASGGWSGSKATSGSQSSGPIDSSTTFGLSCSGAGGSVSRSVTVSVTPSPTLSFLASPTTVSQGASAQLTWSTSNATSCTASGDWSGSKATSGTQSTGPLSTNASYSLNCSGPSGTVSRTATVTVNAAAPTLTFTATPSTVDEGDSVALVWSASNATSCVASGNWSGSKATSGSQTVGPLSTNAQFVLSCTGSGGSVSETRDVTVVPAAPADPTAELTASPEWVARNGSTTLSWTTANVDTCTASGGWNGAKATGGGSQTVGPLTVDQTYTLTCSGTGGSVVSAVSVGVRSAQLSWEAPTQNVDGSPLTDLVGYYVYYGQGSRNYTSKIPIDGASTLEKTIDLTPGTYFFAVTARNAADEESAFSGEVSKTIQ